MDAAAKVLIVGGVLNLALAFALGFVLSRARLKDPAKEQGWLLQAHRVGLWEGFMLLGLVFAVELSPLSASWETTGALLLVAASVFQDASSLVNWRQGIDDQFVNRRAGYTLAVINAILGSAGLVILIVGVFRGL